jgi:hypothetical protein
MLGVLAALPTLPAFFGAPAANAQAATPLASWNVGPAGGLPDTKVGTFTQSLMDEANARAWTVISMKNDWKRIFTFDA